MDVRRDQPTKTLQLRLDPAFDPIGFDQMVLGLVEPGDLAVVIDCSRVALLHSPSLAILTGLYMALRKQGCHMRITGLNQANYKTFLQTRLSDVLDIDEVPPPCSR